MDRARASTGNCPPPLLLLLALASFLRMLVPAGWMPAEQGFGLRLCDPPAGLAAPAPPEHHQSGHGSVAAHHASPSDPLPAEPAEEHKQQQTCSFTMLAAALLAPPPIPELQLPPEAALAARARPRTSATIIAVAALPPPSTGPPALP